MVSNTLERRPRDPKVLIAVRGEVAIEGATAWLESIETACVFREAEGSAEGVSGFLR